MKSSLFQAREKKWTLKANAWRSMKLIQNSVDKEHLLLSESNVELEVEMANFQTVQLNGSKIEERFSQKVPLEEKVQMTNGIHETLEPTSKKISNGYYDGISEEDYQLVLESSSEEGESPLKKIDEDCISAPQLVQEIEDLLGKFPELTVRFGLLCSEPG